MEQIKILHLVPGLASGGISSVILNYYKHMDHEKIRFDFAVFMPELGESATEFKKMGSEIFVLPTKSQNMREYKKQLMKLIRNGDYDIVHAHQNYQSFIPLYYAKKCGVKTRIAHAHTTEIDKPDIIKKMILYASHIINPLFITDYFACGTEAGRAMFGKQMTTGSSYVLKNAVLNQKFSYSNDIREKIRLQMGWDDKLVIGNIGRLTTQKNQLFLIDIFSKIVQTNENAVLCICGDGPDREKIESYINEKNVKRNVHMLGNRSDIPDLMNGFDIFVLTSLFEGLPVTGIEALTNGLPCVMSDTITDEFDEYKRIKFMSLQNSADEWAENILETAKQGHDPEMASLMKKSGYDIIDNGKWLEKFYTDKVFNSEITK